MSVPAVPTHCPRSRSGTAPRRAATARGAVPHRGPAADADRAGHRAERRSGWRAVALTGKAGEVQPGPAGSAARWVAGVGDGEPGQWRAAGAALVSAHNARLADEVRRLTRTLQLELPAGRDRRPGRRAGARPAPRRLHLRGHRRGRTAANAHGPARHDRATRASSSAAADRARGARRGDRAGPRPRQHPVERQGPGLVRAHGRDRTAGRAPGVDAVVRDEPLARRAGLRRRARGRRRLVAAAAVRRAELGAGGARATARRAGRQGHHVRHRRHLDQAAPTA